MHKRKCFCLLFCLLISGGCRKEKSTDELIQDLDSPYEKDRIIAVRLLQHRQGDADRVVPALIKVLRDKDGDMRCSAAIGLGYFGQEAQEAIPALEKARRDQDARVREAAGVALSRIDPARFPDPHRRGAKRRRG
jgi:HEAT repeat protein